MYLSVTWEAKSASAAPLELFQGWLAFVVKNCSKASNSHCLLSSGRPPQPEAGIYPIPTWPYVWRNSCWNRTSTFVLCE